MKKYILMVLFFINFAFVFQHGKLEVTAGVEVKAQDYGGETTWQNEFMSNEEWMAATSPDPNAIGDYLNNLSSGDHISYEFYHNYVEGTTNENSFDVYDYFFVTAHYENDVLVPTHYEYRYSFIQLDGTIVTGVIEVESCPDGSIPCLLCGVCGCNGECLDPTVNGDGADIGKKHESKPGDKLFKNNFTQTMFKQLPNTCVTSIMEYINHQLCGGNINEGTYQLSYLQMTGNDVNITGVSLNNIGPLTNVFFNTATSGSVISILNNGGVVMTDIPSIIGGSTHNVLIVGYNSNDGTFIYMDPEFGYLKTASVDDFKFDYTYGITGCK